jgi:hypothetical protein
MPKKIKIACQGAALLELDQLEPLQGKLKTLTPDNCRKLRESIEDFGFSFPIFIWRRDGHFYTLDGHQRALVLNIMRGEGWEIPPLPVDWIDALDWKEAKSKLLLAISQYGDVSKEGLFDYMEDAGIDPEWLSKIVDIPELDMKLFEAEFLKDGDTNTGNENDEWMGMPEFGNSAKAFRSLIVHFETEDDFKRFCELLGCKLTDKTKFSWFPEKERQDLKGKAFSSES